MRTEAWNQWKRRRVLAACAVALTVVWAFHSRVMTPLRNRATETARAVADLKGRIEVAQTTIEEIRTQEMDSARIQRESTRLDDVRPVGPAMVALPALIKEHFARSGIAVPLIRLTTTQEEPGLPGYEHYYWSVALPIDAGGRIIPTMLGAVADLGQGNIFVRVLDFAIRPDPENPSGRVASMNVTALIQK